MKFGLFDSAGKMVAAFDNEGDAEQFQNRKRPDTVKRRYVCGTTANADGGPTVYQGNVTKVSRLSNSINGNPRYAVWLDGIGRFVTPVDAGWIYGISWHVYEGLNVRIETGSRPNSRTMQSITAKGIA